MFYKDYNLSSELDKITPNLPRPYEFSTDDNDNNDNLKNEDCLNMSYTILNDPFKSIEENNNPNTNIYFTTFNEPNILPEPDNYNNSGNLIPSEESKVDENIGDSSAEMEEEEEKVEKKQKRKKNREKNNNTRFNDNNIIRKCKKILLMNILYFINERIKEFYNNNIGHGTFQKKLQKLNKNQTSESNVKLNQELLNKTIKDIFSDDIFGRINNLPKDHNKKLIQNLLNEKDLKIRDYFTKLFNLTFKQCLQHFIGQQTYNELKGMKLFVEEKNKYKDDKEYAELLECYFKNYEKRINNKKTRKPRKKNDNKK